MKITTVEEFLKRRVAPGQRPIVTLLRKLMKKHAPGAREVITYGILGWKAKRILAVVSPTKKDITFAFSRGASFDDRNGLLRGAGRVSKHVKLKSADEADLAALRYFIKQAVKREKE